MTGHYRVIARTDTGQSEAVATVKTSDEAHAKMHDYADSLIDYANYHGEYTKTWMHGDGCLRVLAGNRYTSIEIEYHAHA